MPHVPHSARYYHDRQSLAGRAVTREASWSASRALRVSLVRVVDEAPWVSQIANRHHVEIGGFAVAPGGKRVVVVATLDNLLKGAATQAMQNLNLAFGFAELEAIPDD